MLLTKTKALLGAHREASQRVAHGRKYSVDLPIVGRVLVPAPEQLAIYAALGGLAVLELVDWPVAVAMGVGSALISRHLSDLESREAELEEAIGAKPEDSAGMAAPGPAARKPAVKKSPSKKSPAKKTGARTASPHATAKKAPAAE